MKYKTMKMVFFFIKNFFFYNTVFDDFSSNQTPPKIPRKREMTSLRIHSVVSFLFSFLGESSDTLAYFYLSDSRFTQQELPACKPILTPAWASSLIDLISRVKTISYCLQDLLLIAFQVITAYMLVAVVFIPIGLASLSASESVN